MFFVFEVVCKIEATLFAENMLGEFVVLKADLRAEMQFSLVVYVLRGFSDFVEPPHCEIIGAKALFGVVRLFSAALYVLRGFID
ncbi:TPA: hypothetical protein ACVOYV_004473 [Vibrio diabolicus]